MVHAYYISMAVLPLTLGVNIMLTIVYRIKEQDAPRSIKVPSISVVRNMCSALRSRLDWLVNDFGENEGAEKYCRECFSTNAYSVEIIQA